MPLDAEERAVMALRDELKAIDAQIDRVLGGYVGYSTMPIVAGLRSDRATLVNHLARLASNTPTWTERLGGLFASKPKK